MSDILLLGPSLHIQLNLFSRLLVVVTLALTAWIAHAAEPLSNYDPLAIFGVSFFTVCLLLIMLSIGVQAQSKGDITRSVWMTVRPRIVILIDHVMFNTDEWDWWISRFFEIRASIVLSGGETVSWNDGVVVVYQSCRQWSASSHGRRYRVASLPIPIQVKRTITVF